MQIITWQALSRTVREGNVSDYRSLCQALFDTNDLSPDDWDGLLAGTPLAPAHNDDTAEETCLERKPTTPCPTKTPL